jgi:hypothetical protein
LKSKKKERCESPYKKGLTKGSNYSLDFSGFKSYQNNKAKAIANCSATAGSV